MKFFIILHIIALLGIIYGLSTDLQNIILAAGFVTVSSAIVFVWASIQNIIAEIGESFLNK